MIAATPKIDLQGVGKVFRRSRPGAPDAAVEVLRDVTLRVDAGEFVCLLGPSGCGKSTLLRLIDGLIEPDAGQIRIDGQGPPVPGPRIGFVFQSFQLMPWLTVQQNVEFPLRLQGLTAAERGSRAREQVAAVGLAGFAAHYPYELSGGMRQRVGLARALAMRPEVLLMDEPFAALDAQTRELMQIELCSLWERTRLAVLFVTHSLDEAIFLADRILLFGPRPGRVEEELPVPLPRPRWSYDIHACPEFARMRAHLWERIREMVSIDAGRGPAGDQAGEASDAGL